MGALEISRATAYFLCLAQLAVTLGVVLCFPTVQVQTFTCHPAVRNGTADLTVSAPVSGGSLALGMPILAISAVAALFSTTTMGLAEEGVMGLDYGHDALAQTGLWDVMFWGFCSLAHFVVVGLVITPGDTFAAFLSGLLLAFFLHRACSPKANDVSMTQENLNLLGYAFGILIAVYAAPPGANRLSALFVMAVMDYFVGIGHTWDRQATLETITSCRLLYVCATSLCIAACYGAWHDKLLAG